MPLLNMAPVVVERDIERTLDRFINLGALDRSWVTAPPVDGVQPEQGSTGLDSTDPSHTPSREMAIDELKRDMNASANPCTDFYEYACGEWMARTNLTAETPTVGRGFSSLCATPQPIS